VICALVVSLSFCIPYRPIKFRAVYGTTWLHL
jgi:hypothetical protein